MYSWRSVRKPKSSNILSQRKNFVKSVRKQYFIFVRVNEEFFFCHDVDKSEYYLIEKSSYLALYYFWLLENLLADISQEATMTIVGSLKYIWIHRSSQYSMMTYNKFYLFPPRIDERGPIGLQHNIATVLRYESVWLWTKRCPFHLHDLFFWFFLMGFKS